MERRTWGRKGARGGARGPKERLGPNPGVGVKQWTLVQRYSRCGGTHSELTSPDEMAFSSNLLIRSRLRSPNELT